MMKNLIIILLSSFLVSGISNYKDISTPVELDLHDQIGEDISPKDIHAHHENPLAYSVDDVSFYLSDGSYFIRQRSEEGGHEYIYVPILP